MVGDVYRLETGWRCGVCAWTRFKSRRGEVRKSHGRTRRGEKWKSTLDLNGDQLYIYLCIIMMIDE